MAMLNKLRLRLRGLFFKPKMEDELQAELQFHLEREIEENIVRGMSPEEARYAAFRNFGGVERVKEESRDVRGIRLLEELWQDLRYGVRMLRKQPGFTLIAVLTLALGIGANTAILSTVNGFILRPLPAEKPDELIVPFWGSKKDTAVWGGVSYANYVDLRERNQSLSGLLVWSLTWAGISAGPSEGGVRAEVVFGELVSGNYFDVLGVKPALGRGFLPEEDRTQNTHSVVVIS